MRIPVRFITPLAYLLVIPTPLLVTGTPLPRNFPSPTVERRIHINPPGPIDSRYAYVPFEVPRQAVRIKVSYQYDRANGSNTIDVGLFDARFSGKDTDPRGFRGWSGGRRSEFFVSRAEATPGYLRGDLPAGTWRIIFGLYRVAPGGVDISVKVEVETRDTVRASTATDPPPITPSIIPVGSGSMLKRPSTGQKVAANGARWWLGDLHMHTVHSDGNWTIGELISRAQNNGLNFIVITDHNTASHHEEIDRLSKLLLQPLVLRGEEITTYGGHTNAWGLPFGTWMDFRTRPGDSSRMSAIAGKAHRAGALISINHPFAACGGCSWTYDAAASDFDAIEVWNGPWDLADESALKMWDKILQSGRRITAVASSDSHRPDTPIGKPSTHVASKVLSQAALLTAIRAGHAYLSEGAAGGALSFEAELIDGKRRARSIIGDEIHLNGPGKVRFLITTETTPDGAVVSLISNGQVTQSFPARTDGKPQVVEIDCQRDSYFRLEVRDGKNAMLALTNPIYVRLKSVKKRSPR
jgi:hypothetical protein